VGPAIIKQNKQYKRLHKVEEKVIINPNIRFRGSLTYPTQNAIRPVTNSIEHTGITASDCDVRYVQSMSCPITWRTNCSVVFRRYLWWVSIICSPLPSTGFIAVLWNRMYITHRIPEIRVKAGSICHLSVYTSRARTESDIGMENGKTRYPRQPEQTVNKTPASPALTTNWRSSGNERIPQSHVVSVKPRLLNDIVFFFTLQCVKSSHYIPLLLNSISFLFWHCLYWNCKHLC
jgi:hypothetical protein